jgi:hypothetical protein
MKYENVRALTVWSYGRLKIVRFRAFRGRGGMVGVGEAAVSWVLKV